MGLSVIDMAIAVAVIVIACLIYFLNRDSKSKEEKVVISLSDYAPKLEENEDGIELKNAKMTIPYAFEIVEAMKEKLIRDNKMNRGMGFDDAVSSEGKEMMKAAVAVINEHSIRQGKEEEVIKLPAKEKNIDKEILMKAAKYYEDLRAGKDMKDYIKIEDDHPLAPDPRDVFEKPHRE